MDWVGIEDQELFLDVIKTADMEFVSHHNKKAEQQRKAGAKL